MSQVYLYPRVKDYTFPSPDHTNVASIPINPKDKINSSYSESKQLNDYEKKQTHDLNPNGDASFPAHLLELSSPTTPSQVPTSFYTSLFCRQSLEAYPCTMSLSQSTSLNDHMFIGGLGAAINAQHLLDKNIMYIIRVGDGMPPRFNGAVWDGGRVRTVRGCSDIRVTYLHIHSAKDTHTRQYSTHEWMDVFKQTEGFMRRVHSHQASSDSRQSTTDKTDKTDQNSTKTNTNSRAHKRSIASSVSVDGSPTQTPTDDLQSRRPISVLIHSYHGCHRAAVVAASVLVSEGHSVEVAMAVVSAARPMVRWRDGDKEALDKYASLRHKQHQGVCDRVKSITQLAVNDRQAFTKLVLGNVKLLFIVSMLLTFTLMVIWALIFGKQAWKWAERFTEEYFHQQLTRYQAQYYPRRT